jgi:Ni,Fe-hydrogenase III large subunit
MVPVGPVNPTLTEITRVRTWIAAEIVKKSNNEVYLPQTVAALTAFEPCMNQQKSLSVSCHVQNLIIDQFYPRTPR